MMPNSPEVMRIQYQMEQERRRPINPDQRERPLRRRERRPDPIGMQMMRMPVEEMVDDVDRHIDRGRGKLRDVIAVIMRRLPAGPFSTATGER